MKKTIFENFDEIQKKIEDFENQLTNNKKSGQLKGTVYTPEIICRYICLKSVQYHVNNILKQQEISKRLDLIKDPNFISLKSLLKEKNNLRKVLNKSFSSIKILDPACGTGRFLISITTILYQLIKILNHSDSDFKIKRSIIENNIFGVDLDSEAVNLCKLRLIKWCYNGNLPQKDNIIKDNINIGNFLIDFYLNQKKQTQLISNNKNSNIKNFKSPSNFKNSTNKFDIILGNPPYIENKKMKSSLHKQILKKYYKTAYKLYDLSILFIERAYQLLEKGGYCLYIITNKFLSADYGLKIRKFLLNHTKILEIIDISSLKVFEKASTYPIIISFQKTKVKIDSKHAILIKNSNEADVIENILFKKKFLKKINQNSIKNIPSFVIPIYGNLNIIRFLLTNFKPLQEIYKKSKFIYRPFTFTNWASYLDLTNSKKKNEKDLILIGTSNIGKFHIKFNKEIKIANRRLFMSFFPYDKNFNRFWSDLQKPKLIFKEIAKDMTAVYDPGYFINITGAYMLLGEDLSVHKLFSLSVIMNSKCVDYIFKSLFSSLHMASGYLRFNGSFLKRIPLPSNIPQVFSKLGKLLHFLHQLKYEIIQDQQCNCIQEESLKSIVEFFTKLIDCLVYYLYFSEIIQKNNIYCKEILKIMKNKNIFPDIIEIFPYRKIKSNNFRQLVPFKFENILDQIVNLYNFYSNSNKLNNEMTLILNHKWIKLIENT